MVRVKTHIIIKNVISRPLTNKQVKKIQASSVNRFVRRVLQNGAVIKFIYGWRQSLRGA